MNSRKRKHLSRGEMRVIRVPKEAVWELVYETVMDRMPEYFDLLTGVGMPCHISWDVESGDMTIAVQDSKDDIAPNMEKVIETVPYTTESLLSTQRPYYCTVMLSEDGEYRVVNDYEVTRYEKSE